ncbi:MAG: hypothetical protein BGO33_07155 [Bacteroidia bacterium 43-41]|nr:MAG: hypothetical protein BGO33_07155 [Bacteroidia bacterium 43-41]
MIIALSVFGADFHKSAASNWRNPSAINGRNSSYKTMSDNTKISIRFFDDREVRAVWDEENNKGSISRKSIA